MAEIVTRVLMDENLSYGQLGQPEGDILVTMRMLV